MKELTTVNEQKEKLSSLCRDLQQNLRSTIEKHKEDLISEAKKRNELHDQFEGSLTELSKKMEEEKVKREEQKESGEAFQTKIIGTLKEFEQKEKQYHLQLEKYKIELELSDAKLQQQVLINNELKDAV